MTSGSAKIPVLLALLAATAVGLNSSAPAQGPGGQGRTACGCEDIKDLRSRACAASAAVAEWERQIGKARAEERRTGQPEQMSLKVKEEVDSCVGLMISLNNDQGENPKDANPWTGDIGAAHKAGGGTDDATCEITINAPTKCLAEATMAHETVHALSCMAQNKNRGWLERRLSDFRFSHSSTTWMSEEKAAYEVEHNHIRGRLMELSKRCPKAFFESTKPDGTRDFTLEWCPRRKPSPDEWANCKRQ